MENTDQLRAGVLGIVEHIARMAEREILVSEETAKIAAALSGG